MRALLTLLFSVSILLAHSQNDPKIGLVLSGGGAKGMAHIGVLKVLEEVGIVPDFITGTSMGAVVGGLYAVGYSPAELEEIALTANWDILLGNQISYENINMENKPYYSGSQLTLPIDGVKIGLPKGVIEGQELSEFLSRLTAHVHDVSDFENLPRPFKCIGADIVTGDKVVLSNGFLPTAIRASMAIPSIFTPVEIDGKLLVDGGLVHNFPAIEAVEMGADIIIGVSVSDSLVQEDQLNSLVAILNQATFINSYKATLGQMQYVDYFIRPTMYPYSTGSFANGDSIIQRGETAARNMYPQLKALADSIKRLRSFEPIVKPQLPKNLIIDSVVVFGNSDTPSHIIKGKLDIYPGDTVTMAELKYAVDVVYGTLAFDYVNYELLSNGSTVVLTVRVKEASPGRAQFNLHYDTENGAGLMAILQYRDLGIDGSRLTIQADIAETPFVLGEYFFYLGADQKTGISLGAKYFQDNISLFNLDGDAEAVYRTKLWKYFVNFNTTTRLDRTFGIELFSENLVMKPRVASAEERLFDKLRYANFGFRPYFSFNQLNRRLLPTHGYRLNVGLTTNLYMNVTLQGFEPDFSSLEPDYVLASLQGDYEHYFPINEKWTFYMSHLLRLTNMEVDKINISDFNFSGGYRPSFINSSSFWGAEKYQFQLTSFYKAVFGVRWEFLKNLTATIATNFLETEYPMALVGDDFFEQSKAAEQDRRLGFMLGIGYRTLVGPIQFQLSKDIDSGKFQPWFSIGYNFPSDPFRGN